jgi:putative acetyltransferase
MADRAGALTIVEDCTRFTAPIAAMTVAAFARAYGTGQAEADLIARLRAEGDVVVERAAFAGEELVGHILFSRVRDNARSGRIAGLAPVSVRVGRQKSGIGTALIRSGLDACRVRGIGAVIVLGDPAYYGRFGFSATLGGKLACAYSGPHFQALELVSSALDGVMRVDYAPAFAASGV